MPNITAYRQLESSDCGITCIRIIAKFYGKNIPLKYLREKCDSSRIGISLKDITTCTESLGFKTTALKVPVKNVYHMPLPAILYWEQRHYVVLYKINHNKDTFYIVDPAQGKICFKKNDFYHYWMEVGNNGIAVLLAPTQKFYDINFGKDKCRKKGLFKLLIKSIVLYKRNFSIAILFISLATIADIILPILFQYTIDIGIGNKDINLVWLLVFSQFCIFLGNYISNNIVDIVLTKTGLKISIELVSKYLTKLINLPMSFFDRKISTDLIQKVDDQNRVKNFLVNMPDTTFFTFVNIIVFSGMLIHYNFTTFTIVFISTLISFIWVSLFVKKRREVDYSYFSYSSENRNNIYELVNGMAEIKINNAQQIRISIWNSIQQKLNKLSLKIAFMDLSINSGNILFLRLKDILITGLCATMVIKEQMTIGTMMTISYIIGRLTSPVSNLINSVNTIQDATISYERLNEVMTDQPQSKFPYTKINTPDNIDNILEFKNVSFKYPGSYSQYVIKNITTTIPLGKVTAIVGASGSGKSTLIKLMLGFYTPQCGTIHSGLYNISEINNDSWLKECGVVMQSGYIFSGSILDNIALSDSTPNIIKARNAAKIACIDGFFETLPMGYNTKIGVNGLDLSGGQKQRLYLARAIYKNPKLLFLDEATSSLDASNERNIINNIISYYKNRTIIISAHRLSTIKNADKIIYLDNGKIKEEGTHEQLINLKGLYYTLVKNQLS